MAFDDVLAERIRDRLRDVDGVIEKKMFGGLAFLSYGNMTVGVHGDDLIARIDPAATDAALKQPGVRIFDITGRPMKGWILVAGELSGVAGPVKIIATSEEVSLRRAADTALSH
jgi:TfoX N-terminal domain